MQTSHIAFQPWKQGRLSLRNRIVMAPMTRRRAPADTGVVTEESVAYYRRRAANEVGLIIGEGTVIDSLHAYDTPTVPRIETAEQIAGWKRVVDAVHEEGGAFAPQIWHCGRFSESPIGPSATPVPPRPDGTPRPVPRPMEADDFAQVLAAYEHAARASVEIGADALEIHGAHGYLLDSFLSPMDNLRDDEYGGSVENRMHFPLTVVGAMRAAVGDGYPIIYRFSQWKLDDYRAMKFQNSEELRVWVEALREAGVDILHVSTRDAMDPAFPDEGNKTLAGWSRELSGLPTISVGQVTLSRGMDRGREGVVETKDPASALNLLDRGEADLLAVGRALIANPDWVPLVREGRWLELKPYSPELLNQLV
jgi:2,4-dienoyl-CoA reductase-like NADH-dependent reductase (Old Yellow Enzyme family)